MPPFARPVTAWRLETAGQPPVRRDVPDALPGAGQVRVAIRAAALNYADMLMIRGAYQDIPPLPFTLGMELAGVVTHVGEDVRGLAPGDRVVVFAGQGALATAGLFPAAACWPIPAGMPFDHAAAFPIAYGTSHLALSHRAGLKAGQTLAVIGAAGGVGLTAVEIGARLGARVIACARGADKLAVARAAGAHEAVDSSDPDLRARLRDLGGVDVVYDAVGGAPGTAGFGALRAGGHFLVIGFAGGGAPDLKLNHALVKNITIHGLYWGGYARLDPEVMAASMSTLLGWYAKGGLAPHISARFPLDQADRAIEALGAGRATGKIVVEMPDPDAM